MDRKQLAALVTALAAVVIVALVIAVNAMHAKKVAPETPSVEQTQEKPATPEISAEQTMPADYTHYYIGVVSILETQTTHMSGHMEHNSMEDIVFDSEELLIYDDKTEKCYIMGRRLTYESSLLVTETHPYFGTLTDGGRGYGETAEKYGRGGSLSEFEYTTAEGVVDYSAFPVRVNVAEGLIYTLVPTKNVDWVEKQNGDEVYLDPPTALIQEAIKSDLVTDIPEISEIDISEEITPDYAFLFPGMSVEGIFVFQFRRATMEEVQNFGAELSEEIAIRQQYGELALDLVP